MGKQIYLLHKKLNGELKVPGDKSMSHRSIIFASLSKGTSIIENFLLGEDCLSTMKAFQQMGVQIDQTGNKLTIKGNGIHSLKEPKSPIDFGNSGTTARLMFGVLAGQAFHSVLIGDDSLSRRPMDRVTVPLRSMGAIVDGRDNGSLLPMSIRGGKIKPITYTLPVNSAQVKSAILLAGLFAEDGHTTVVEPVPTRDHTERMINAFGGVIEKEDNHITIKPNQQLTGAHVIIPGDISSAAFFITAAVIAPNSRLTIREVGLNPTRTGIIDVFKYMGATIDVNHTKPLGDEPVGDVSIKTSALKGISLDESIIPRIIDEIPLLALAATQAEGVTEIRHAKELRYKETDRIKAVVEVLTKLGADITEVDDGMIIRGKTILKGNKVPTFGDHRIGMMAAIASLVTSDPVEMDDADCIRISYPNFFEHLQSIVE